MELTSQAWLLAVWHGPARLTVHKLAAFVYVATLVAPFSLDPPLTLEFECAVTACTAMTVLSMPTRTSLPSHRLRG